VCGGYVVVCVLCVLCVCDVCVCACVLCVLLRHDVRVCCGVRVAVVIVFCASLDLLSRQEALRFGWVCTVSHHKHNSAIRLRPGKKNNKKRSFAEVSMCV
jgi:hypothetical protein